VAINQHVENAQPPKGMREILVKGYSCMLTITAVISHSFRTNPHIVANATVTIESDAGAICINDGRVLLNRNGVLWFSLPTHSIQKGRQYEYKPTVELSPSLALQVSAEVLRAYEVWRDERSEGQNR
jgi:hypothetical protein